MTEEIIYKVKSLKNPWKPEQARMVAPDYHYGRTGMQVFQVASEFAPLHRNPMVLINWYNAVKYLLRYHRKSKKVQQLQDLRKCYTSVTQLLEIYEHDEHPGHRKSTTTPSYVPDTIKVPPKLATAPSNDELPDKPSPEAFRPGGTGVPTPTTGRHYRTGGGEDIVLGDGSIARSAKDKSV